jgi:hypothetical protein
MLTPQTVPGGNMQLTIDNHDGRGAVDYTSALVAGRPFRIERRLNAPVTCALSLLPSSALPAPARNGRILVCDDSGLLLFTGYIATEPALELAGQGSAGAVYIAVVAAISDDILLSRQYLPQANTVAPAASQALQVLLARMELAGIVASIPPSLPSTAGFQVDAAHTWGENVGALSTAIRNAWRLMDGTLTIAPVGNVTHTLSETQGTLSLSDFQISLLKALANDVTVCGEVEPCAYVTEYFQGDGATLLFNLTEEPYTQPAAKQKPLLDTFSGPTVNPQLWMLDDPGAFILLTANGLTCAGGNGSLGVNMLCAVSDLELGGAIVIEAANVQFGAQTSGIINGLFGGGGPTLPNCFLGFQIAQASGAASIAPLVNGAAAGTPFTPVAGHLYTLRLRLYVAELQRAQQTYYVAGTPSGIASFGGLIVDSAGSAVLEVQDVTNGIAGAPVVLWSGSLPSVPPTCSFIPLNSAYLQCSIGSITVDRQGPQWVVSTPPNGTPIVRRIGTAAQGADCTLDHLGRLKFYPASTPQAGEVIAVSYRTRRRAVARLASAASITMESQGGLLPGAACWMGSVTNPPARSSVDCENAADAMLSVATSRAAAWTGKYTAWNPEQQGDIWPGDTLAVSSASAGVTANLIVRAVQIDLTTSVPGLAKYTISFANDWAEELSIQTSTSIPADAWLPQQPETTPPLASLNTLAVTSVTGSDIAIAAGVNAPAGGGFEVRRRDWAFTPGPGPDLVLRSPVPSFSIPRAAATEQYYIRMYDASTPPNYSRFSAAVFVNLPLTGN